MGNVIRITGSVRTVRIIEGKHISFEISNDGPSKDACNCRRRGPVGAGFPDFSESFEYRVSAPLELDDDD